MDPISADAITRTHFTQLAVIEKSFLYELTRRKALFRPFKEPIIEAVNAQLEVNDVRRSLPVISADLVLTTSTALYQRCQNLCAQACHRA